jgi:hypothetical protein
MKKIILLLIFLFAKHFAIAQWSYIGLAHAGITTNLTIANDTIYASTHDGIYKKYIYSADTNWIACGMQGRHVVQTLVPSHQEFICVAEIGTTLSTQIYNSINGGMSFNLMNPDTSNFNNYQFLNAIAHPEGNYDTLYFLNHQLKTYDRGLTWDTIPNMVLTDRFIKVNPVNHDELIIGGETFILSAYLQTSPDNGSNWTFPGMTNYFAGDNCVHDMVMDNNNTWTAAGEGVICRTTDGGNNWTQLLNVWSWPIEWALYMWDIETSLYFNNLIYVTGDNSQVTQVPLFYSTDNGTTWDTLSCAAAVPGPQIKCLAVKSTVNEDYVFLGGNGVYIFYNPLVGMPEKESVLNSSFTLSPNPATTTIFIERNTASTPATLQLLDCFGRKVEEIKIAAGEKRAALNVKSFAAGIYFVCLADEKEQVVRKVVVQR